MTDIKFRAWDNKLKRMYQEPWNYIAVGYQFCGFQTENNFQYFQSWHDADLIAMQFTGWHDKHGKEIYFGDILQTSNDGKDGADIWTPQDYGYTVVMEQEGQLGVVANEWIPEYSKDSVFDFRYVEVVGNIYETPELLKESP